MIQEDAKGLPDLNQLERELQHWSSSGEPLVPVLCTTYTFSVLQLQVHTSIVVGGYAVTSDLLVLVTTMQPHHSRQLQVTVLTWQATAFCSSVRSVRRIAGAPLILGSFSAGSNVTGIAPDAQAIAALLHRYGAIAAFDYASAGSCKRINCAGSGIGGLEMRAQRTRTHGAVHCSVFASFPEEPEYCSDKSLDTF